MIYYTLQNCGSIIEVGKSGYCGYVHILYAAQCDVGLFKNRKAQANLCCIYCALLL